MVGKKRVINEDTVLYEDDNPANYTTENELDIDEQEEVSEDIPEAFIPSFTVAPDDIPLDQQVHIPTEDEQKATLDSLYKKLGIKAKAFIDQPPQPMTPEKERFVSRTSLMGARIFSAVSMWCFSIFGYEYGMLAPTVEQSQKMIEPIMRIVSRHSKMIGNISPDVDDTVEALTAMSDYAVTAMALMQQIREDKALNNGRYTGQYASPLQARPSGPVNRSNDNRGYPPHDNERSENGGVTESEPTSNLTGYEQYNHDMLRTLSERDYAYRARRSGRI